MTPELTNHPLHTLPKYGDGIGLHRVRYLMERCGIDANAVSERALVVTGSNGKGSTARIASALLTSLGARVGLFTSPHLYRYNERFRIDGEPAGDDALIAAMDRVAAAVASWRGRDAIGAFEAQFVTALALFFAQDCRWLVLEAGIGGRYDPVRLACAPVAALASLDLEHTELLGNTLLEIALDKFDAAAPGGTVVLGESCLPFRDEISAFATASAREAQFVEAENWRDLGVRDAVQHFAIGDDGLEFPDLRSPLIGRHQINNHAVALALVRARLRRAGIDLPADTGARWRDAIAQLRWPGRLETISKKPLVVIDVGHTPEGIRAALDGFRALTKDRKTLLVTGGSKNKAVADMLAILAPAFDQIICTGAHHKGLPAEAVADIIRTPRPSAALSVCPTIRDAVLRARVLAREQDRAIYVAGGLFLAAEFAEAWRGGDPDALAFF